MRRVRPDALGWSVFVLGVITFVGWYAHVSEQRAHGRLIRPASRYVGPRA